MFYHLKDKVVTNDSVYTDDKGNTWFLNALDDAQLKAFGYAKVIEGEYPKEVKDTQEVRQVASLDEAKNIYNINYEVVDKGLDELKRLKIAEIDNERDRTISGGVSFKDKMFQSAEKDRNLLTSTVSLFTLQKAVPEGFAWISTDNTQVPFTLEELIQLANLMASSVQTNMLKARNLKDKVLNAKSADEVAKINWEEAK